MEHQMLVEALKDANTLTGCFRVGRREKKVSARRDCRGLWEFTILNEEGGASSYETGLSDLRVADLVRYHDFCPTLSWK